MQIECSLSSIGRENNNIFYAVFTVQPIFIIQLFHEYSCISIDHIYDLHALIGQLQLSGPSEPIEPQPVNNTQ